MTWACQELVAHGYTSSTAPPANVAQGVYKVAADMLDAEQRSSQRSQAAIVAYSMLEALARIGAASSAGENEDRQQAVVEASQQIAGWQFGGLVASGLLPQHLLAVSESVVASLESALFWTRLRRPGMVPPDRVKILQLHVRWLCKLLAEPLADKLTTVVRHRRRVSAAAEACFARSQQAPDPQKPAVDKQQGLSAVRRAAGQERATVSEA